MCFTAAEGNVLLEAFRFFFFGFFFTETKHQQRIKLPGQKHTRDMTAGASY